jgi:hypothetical protein
MPSVIRPADGVASAGPFWASVNVAVATQPLTRIERGEANPTTSSPSRSKAPRRARSSTPNPAEHVLRPMRQLMLSGYDWPNLGLAAAVILALGLIGIPITVRNYRAVYR